MIEVKTTSLVPKNYWIESNIIKKYQELWSSAVLSIVHIPTLNIYCKTIDQINLEELVESSQNFAPNLSGYILYLEEKFINLCEQFRLNDKKELTRFVGRIKN